MRFLLVLIALVLFGFARFSLEHDLMEQRPDYQGHSNLLTLNMREQLGQLGFIAVLGGFRSIVADMLFIESTNAWERTEWPRVLLLFQEITTLQPHCILFWDMAAWHMAWNASVSAFNDPTQPRLALRIKAQREYFDLGRDFLERGIQNNPEQPQLYERLAGLYRDKYKDHLRASEYYDLEASKNGAPVYAHRFAAYELSFCEGREQEACDRLRQLYDLGENERLPTLITRLKFLEDKLNLPLDQRIPDSAR